MSFLIIIPTVYVLTTRSILKLLNKILLKRIYRHIFINLKHVFVFNEKIAIDDFFVIYL